MNIGDLVKKKSKKPFKSGRKVNTIKEFVTNPRTGKAACTFIEDDSVVDLWVVETTLSYSDSFSSSSA